MTESPRTARPYAKAHLSVLHDQDLSPAVKLVAIARERVIALGDRPSPSRLAYETGLSLRKVQYALATLGLKNPPGRPRKRAQKGAQKGAQQGAQCARFRRDTVYNNNQEGESGRDNATTAPPPSAPVDPGKTTAGTAAPPEASEPGPDALVSMIALRFGGRFSDAEIAGHIASDTAARLYTRTDLAAWYAAGRTAAYPSHLKRLVPQFLADQTRGGFVRRVAEIRAGGLTDARHVDGRRAEVRLADIDPPRLILETCEGGVPGATAAELQDQIAGLRWPFVGSAREQGLRRRLETVQAGLPDPAARPGARTQIVVSSPADLAAWTFRPRQPTLFSLDGPPARAPP